HESQSAVLPSKMTLTLSPLAGGQTRLIMDVSYRFLPQLGFISRAFERLVMNRVLSGVIHQNQVNLDRYLQRTVFPGVVAGSAVMLSVE
ncbi:MAG: hypothetical protein K8I30_09415, partial [Anaerolineae bacterium]|nr:hypothetical protein [Anaerolineae bacterium]